MTSENSFEIVNKKVLTRSVIFTIAYTISALVIGFLTSSQVIIFDGIFNLAGVALTYLSIFAMKFIIIPSEKKLSNLLSQLHNTSLYFLFVLQQLLQPFGLYWMAVIS
jgi:predicted Co/Zn/Cd cation transporter (cation efflux family)